MIQNIFLILITLLLIFFVSNDENINKIISKKYMKYLFLFLIIYFIYQKYNFYLLFITIAIFIFINSTIKDKMDNINLYESYYDFKKTIYEFIESKTLKETFKNNKNSNKIYRENNFNDFDIKPYSDEKKNEENNIQLKHDKQESQKTYSEPFKNNVLAIKDLYENIKNEIKKLK